MDETLRQLRLVASVTLAVLVSFSLGWFSHWVYVHP